MSDVEYSTDISAKHSVSLLELEIHLDEDEEDFFTEEPSTKAKPVDDATVPLGCK